MHIQQPEYNKHGQTVGEDPGTAYKVQQDLSEGVVRCATAETARMATDNTATGVIPGHTRGQHKVHAGQFRRGERLTHIQGLRDPENATESSTLARKRGRKYATKKELLRIF